METILPCVDGKLCATQPWTGSFRNWALNKEHNTHISDSLCKATPFPERFLALNVMKWGKLYQTAHGLYRKSHSSGWNMVSVSQAKKELEEAKGNRPDEDAKRWNLESCVA